MHFFYVWGGETNKGSDIVSMISIKNLTFAYDGSYDNIFENLSLNIDTDWKLGLTGRNGRGKTTFLKLLCGELDSRSAVAASVNFCYFPFPVSNEDDLTIDVLRQVSGAEDWRIIKEAFKLLIDEQMIYTPFSYLSKGQQTRALLSAMFLTDNAFLLIDEPTNHLDADARRVTAEYLNGKRGFILVSHDRDFLDACTDHTLSINRSGVEIIKGGISVYLENKKRREIEEQRTDEKLKKDIERLNAAAKRQSDWSDRVEKTKYGSKNSGLRVDRGYVGHKSAKMMKRAKAIEQRQLNAAEQKKVLLKDVETADQLFVEALPCVKSRLIELLDLSLYYDGKKVCGPLRLSVDEGDRIAVTGKNGSGKTTLLRLICGENIEYDGGFYLSGRLKIACLPQDSSRLSGSLADYAAAEDVDITRYFTLLRKLGFERTHLEKDLEDLSEGQRKKAALARCLCSRANLYVFDEPLNYIDLISREQVENMIAGSRATMLFVEHDGAFCRRVATKSIKIE